MASPNPNISNGTCFIAGGNVASSNFIPCGNSAFTNYQCCQAGDFCLEDSACFNSNHGTTYLTGCTDSTYQDPACPDKGSMSGDPWTGLIYCDPNRWVACKEAGEPSTIKTGDKCTCPPDSQMTVAFTAPQGIPQIGLLPLTSGGTVNWASDHSPTFTAGPGTAQITTTITLSSTLPSTTTTITVRHSSSTPSDSISATSASPQSTPTPTSTDIGTAPPQANTLSDGAKAGIGIGAGVGGILLFGALSALWLVWRRRRHDKNNNTLSNPEAGRTTGTTLAPGGKDLGPGPGPGPSSGAAGMGSGPAEMFTPEVPPRPATISELMPMGPPWVVRPELQGDSASHQATATATMPSGAGYGVGGGGATGGAAQWADPAVSPPVSALSSSPTAPGSLRYSGHGWPGVTASQLGSVVEEGEGTAQGGYYHPQGYHQQGNQVQGDGSWEAAKEGSRSAGQGVVLELPA